MGSGICLGDRSGDKLLQKVDLLFTVAFNISFYLETISPILTPMDDDVGIRGISRFFRP